MHLLNAGYLFDVNRSVVLKGVSSLAEIGLVWSPNSLWMDGAKKPGTKRPPSLHALNGWYTALMSARIVFDLVADWQLQDDLSRYKILILPSSICLPDSAEAPLSTYYDEGGALVCSYESTLRDAKGRRRRDYLLGPVLGIRKSGFHGFGKWRIKPSSKPKDQLLVKGMSLPSGTGWISEVEAAKDSQVLLSLRRNEPSLNPNPVKPFVVFNPGKGGQGRSLFLATDLDSFYWRTREPTVGKLLARLVDVLLEEKPSVFVKGSGLLDINVWGNEQNVTVHLVNLGSHGRSRTSPGVGRQTLTLRLTGQNVSEVRLLRAGEIAQWEADERELNVVLPSINDFELVAIDFK